jgi:O-methyltransferase domain
MNVVPCATAPPASSTSPAETLRCLISGYRPTFLIQVAAELRLADLLAEGPRDVRALAQATGSDPQALGRLLFALVQLGVFARTVDDRFRLTALGACLRADHPDGLAAFARYQGHDVIQRPWANLLHSVRTGKTAFDAVFGVSLFDYFAAHPEAAELFTAGMAARTAEHLAAIVAAYEWRGLDTIVDIGGADGALLAAVLAAAPEADGIVFDQPHVEDAARRRLAAAGLQNRCRFASGDFFVAVPGGGSAYLLKYIVHDWDDERVLGILRNVRRAAPSHTRLIVIEPLLPEGEEPALEAAMMDIAMLVVTGGGERTASRFAALYSNAGFRLSRVVPTASPFSLVEGIPA